MDTKKPLKQLHALLKIDEEIQKCLIVTTRLEASIKRFSDLLEKMPIPINGKVLNEDWNKSFKSAEAKKDVDIHALMIHSYHLMGLIKKNKDLKNDMTDEQKELIEIMRHHYEHWEGMCRYYRHTEHIEIPPSQPNVDKYFKKYRTAAKESPVGYLSIGRFLNGKFTKNIVIGGAMSLSDMTELFKKLDTKNTKLIIEYREILPQD